MTLEEVTRLVMAGESETLEFKKTTGGLKEAAKTLCAMANQGGGRILFGITPNRTVVGQDVSDRAIEKVSAAIGRITPQVFPTIQLIPVDRNREIIMVQINPGPVRPYRYQGVAYRRVGNTTRAMADEEYNRMLLERMHKEQRWENQPATGWTVNDLDVAAIRNTFAEAVRIGRLNETENQEPEALLHGFRLIRDGALLRAAAVLFGKVERLRYDMPQCLLRVARFRGSDRSEFLDNRQFSGNAFTLLANAERFLSDTLPIAGRFKPDQMARIDEPLYPRLAVREALANAICHRDYIIEGGSIGLAVYDDGLEVTSPGPLHFGLTPDDLFEPHDSMPWNPLIADVFYKRGIIEQWGSGTLKMVSLATSAGLPRPEIEEYKNCVIVRFRPAGYVPSQRNGNGFVERQEMILDLLGRTQEGMAIREIISHLPLGTSSRQVRRGLEALRERGLAKPEGHGMAARWKRI